MENYGWKSDNCLSFRSISRDFYNADVLIDELLAGNFPRVEILFNVHKADPNCVVPERGVAPLHVLAGLDNEDFSVAVTLMALQRRGGDPNVRSDEGLTPVHVAAMWGRCRVLDVLLENGGDPDLVDDMLFLNAAEYALKQQQWEAYGILTINSTILEEIDFTEKRLEKNIHCNTVEDKDVRRNISLSDLGSGYLASSTECSVSKDCDWINKTFEDIPLDQNSIDIINSHRRGTRVYEYPKQRANSSTRSSSLSTEPRRHMQQRGTRKYQKKGREDEMFFCEFTESSFKAKRNSLKRIPSSNTILSDNSDQTSVNGSKVPSRLLCKMSRIFLFMLKKRHIYEEIKERPK